jgi:hypothetical protein
VELASGYGQVEQEPYGLEVSRGDRSDVRHRAAQVSAVGGQLEMAAASPVSPAACDVRVDVEARGI